jgi:hypothetical protein
MRAGGFHGSSARSTLGIVGALDAVEVLLTTVPFCGVGRRGAVAPARVGASYPAGTGQRSPGLQTSPTLIGGAQELRLTTARRGCRDDHPGVDAASHAKYDFGRHRA